VTATSFFFSLIVIFCAAKLFGEIAERLGQPAVLGEMVGGIVVGISGFHLVDPHAPVLELLSELGVILLLFLIGLETDIRRLLRAGGPATAVAITGVALPFAGGFGVARLLGASFPIAIFLGAALTATSVGITARVLSDLGHLHTNESQIILGAAVIDDILGLILLTVVGTLAAGQRLTALGVGKVTFMAFGFVVLALVAGSVLAPRLVDLVTKLRVTKALFVAALIFALALAWLADAAGSGLIIGAFTAGLVLARTERGEEIEREVHNVAHFFVPIFFVLVGAAVDVRQLTRNDLLIGALLTIVGMAGKLVAGYAAPRSVRRLVIGVGMMPRGEVGLIFAQIGLAAGLLSAGLYGAVAMMVMFTTLATPPLLRVLLPRAKRDEVTTLSSVVTESVADRTEKDAP
jgi:Kef-type K+ transport system membrane component KefB